MTQTTLDRRNAEFWDELCGTTLARSLAITTPDEKSLRRFDAAYLAQYPYLERYVAPEPLAGRPLLEIGLGYGTLGELLARSGCLYHGVDIAAGPVEMMRMRLRRLGRDPSRVVQASALELPFDDEAFDYVYSIGCLHHTGDLPRAVSEVYRVLAPKGRAVVMLYNRHSFHRLIHVPLLRLHGARSRRVTSAGRRYREYAAKVYDTNQAGEAAPHTDFVSPREARRLFAHFGHMRVDVQNFETLSFRSVQIPRERFLGNLARVLGLDLYIVADKNA